MKKLCLVIVLALVLCAGCGAEEKKQESPVQIVSKNDESTNSGSNQKEETQDATEQQDEQNQAQPDADQGANEGTQTVSATITCNLYLSDDNAENFIVKEVECTEEGMQNELWEDLKSEGALSPECQLLSLEQNANTLVMDVNKAFGDQLRSMGTSGERMMIGSVVNTYLDAYGCGAIMITEEGGTLYSGHAVYDQYLEKYM